MASPGDVAAARAAGDLREQLERALGRAEVGQPEADVRRDDADERHAREIVALGDHLRADEDVDARRANVGEHAAIAPRRRMVSRSTRATRALGKSARSSASTRSVPKPELLEVRAAALAARAAPALA